MDPSLLQHATDLKVETPLEYRGFRSAQIIEENVRAVFQKLTAKMAQSPELFTVNFEARPTPEKHLCLDAEMGVWIHMHLFEKGKLGTGLLLKLSRPTFEPVEVYGEPNPIAFPTFLNLTHYGFDDLVSEIKRMSEPVLHHNRERLERCLSTSTGIEFGVGHAETVQGFNFTVMYSLSTPGSDRVPDEICEILGPYSVVGPGRN